MSWEKKKKIRLDAKFRVKFFTNAQFLAKIWTNKLNEPNFTLKSADLPFTV